MKTKTIKYLLAAVGISLTPFVASADLVVNGSFETPLETGSYATLGTGSTIGAWTVTAGTVDLIGTYWQAQNGTQSLDMQGSTPGTITQTISGLTTGQQYLLTFYMSGNPDGAPVTKQLTASLGTSSQNFSYTTGANTKTDMQWSLEQVVFTAAGTSEDLQFSDISGPPGTYGAALDNVSLSAVPEPTTIIASALLVLPFGASTLRILRRKRA